MPLSLDEPTPSNTLAWKAHVNGGLVWTRRWNDQVMRLDTPEGRWAQAWEGEVL